MSARQLSLLSPKTSWVNGSRTPAWESRKRLVKRRRRNAQEDSVSSNGEKKGVEEANQSFRCLHILDAQVLSGGEWERGKEGHFSGK